MTIFIVTYCNIPYLCKMIYTKFKLFCLLCTSLFLMYSCTSSQNEVLYSQRMVESLALSPSSNDGDPQLARTSWGYVTGLVANSVLKAWVQYPEKTEYYLAVKHFADLNILEGDSVKVEAHNIDDIAAGKIFFILYLTEKENGNLADAMRYKRCADFLRNKLKYEHRRIEDSQPGAGRWIHKARYPGQLWLDGLYMGPAFYAEWQQYFWEEEGYDANVESWTDIAQQFEINFDHTWNSEKQLNYHAWASDPYEPNAFWAQKDGPNRGASSEFWGRGVGWYFAAIVDALEWMPAQHPNRQRLEEITRMIATGLAKHQCQKTGCWYQLLQYDDSKCADGTGDTMNETVYNKCDNCNYLESSASSMFTYSFLKGIRINVLDKATFLPVALKAYQGLIDTFITENEDGSINIIQSCNSAGLGPIGVFPGVGIGESRTGTANYYLCGGDSYITQNEGKAIGPFIMASLEAELAGILPVFTHY